MEVRGKKKERKKEKKEKGGKGKSVKKREILWPDRIRLEADRNVSVQYYK